MLEIEINEIYNPGLTNKEPITLDVSPAIEMKEQKTDKEPELSPGI